jgi:hypothetical protein
VSKKSKKKKHLQDEIIKILTIVSLIITILDGIKNLFK